jgi:UDP-N-acetylmuramoyl-tripeptide--D-alanyl-D-alanine ligase
MDPATLQFLADAAKGRLSGGSPDARAEGVTTDSRAVRPGWVFVALQGERHDARKFIPEAAAGGAVAVVYTPDPGLPTPAIACIEVDDARAAYGRIAAANRRLHNPDVVAVAGSNGKTSTKDMAGEMIGASLPAVKSAASHNNDVGVPASLLMIGGSTRAAVFEAGTNHPGELAPLLAMIAPRIGVLTGVGREHLEFFGGLEGVAEEEGALADCLPAADDAGVLILPDVTPFADAIIRRTRARVIRVGGTPAADWRATITGIDWGGAHFEVAAPLKPWCGAWRIPTPARHMVVNALAAMAAAAEAGADPAAAKAALASFAGSPRRLSVRNAGGVRVVDDSYNCNADSLLAALHAVAELPCAGRRVAVIGDMAELGVHADDAHAECGRAAARLGFDAVWCAGKGAAATAEAAGSVGRIWADAETLTAGLTAWLAPGDTVLVKASRSSRFDRIADALLDAMKPRCAGTVPARTAA